jgi:hypothetical protein
MSQEWERLSISPNAAPPMLLYKFTTTSNSYQLYVTDLIHIWTEKLTRKEILDRAIANEPSIDPGESLEQLEVFLQKLREALSGAKSSSVTLKSAAKPKNFDIITETELPAPLDPLEWTFCVTQGLPREFTTQLLVPLLEAQVEREESEKTLLKSLKEKDWVLGKIFDKIESLGLDLSTVFPGTAGLRSSGGGVTRTQASKYVPGLATFDEPSWRKGINGKRSVLDFTRFIAVTSIASNKNDDPDKLLPKSDEWWKRLSDYHPKEVARTLQRRKTSPAVTSRTLPATNGDSSDEGEFQVCICPNSVVQSRILFKARKLAAANTMSSLASRHSPKAQRTERCGLQDSWRI